MKDSTISKNTAQDDGGGIWNAGTATITCSTISGNNAVNFGGGILNGGTLTVTGSSISRNTAQEEDGGGIYNYDTATITGSRIYRNIAGNDGGGIYNDGGTLNSLDRHGIIIPFITRQVFDNHLGSLTGQIDNISP